LNGNKYREMLKSLGLDKALQSQLHTQFKPEFQHAVSKYEYEYIQGSDNKKHRPPPLTEDYSTLGNAASEEKKNKVRDHWKRLTPKQRAMRIAKLRANAVKWREKAIRKGTIELREYTTKYIVIAESKNKTNAKPKP
jgi:hypothetical protein